MKDFRQFKALSFDCYGTLIDWESGIHAALQPLLARAPVAVTREDALERFAHYESRQEAATPGMLYSNLLAKVHQSLAEDWRAEATADMHEAFASSVGDWPAFPDSSEALNYLKQFHKLIILSNVDHKSFAGSERRLGVEFDAVYTAQDIGSYKPSPRNFDYLITHARKDFGIEKDQILHVAQSLFHDHEPAKSLGFANVWIDRRARQEGWGATPPPSSALDCDFRFASMAEFAAAHRAGVRAAERGLASSEKQQNGVSDYEGR